jgi:peptidoglycan hydrolase FlgJ
MSEIGLNTILSTSTGKTIEKNPAKIKDAAQQFESMLIEQMLKTARESGSGDWFGTDQAGEPMAEMAEQQFAQLLASNGGMGLAKLVVNGLNRDH